MTRSGGAPTRRWLVYLAVFAAWLLGAELMVVTTLGRRIPGRLPAAAAMAFAVASVAFLLVIARLDVIGRRRTASLVDQLNSALGSITTLTEASLSMLPIDKLLDQMLGRLQEGLPADIAAILLIGEDGHSLELRASHGVALHGSPEIALQPDNGVIGRAIRGRKVCESNDPGELLALAGHLEPPLASVVVCPIQIEGHLIGVCLAGSLERTTRDERELHLLQLVADRAGLGLERSRLDDADRRARTLADRTRRHATLLAAASDAVAAAQGEYERNLADLVDVAVPAFSDWCAIDLVDTSGASRRVVIRHGGDGATPGERNGPQEAWCSAQLRVRIPGIAEMISTAGSSRATQRWGTSCIVTPMGVENEIYGTITFVIDPERAEYEEDDVAVAEDVARRAGVAIERARPYLGARESARMEVIGQLAGGVAHDFNNLLTLISGYTDLLQRDLEGNERAEALVGDIQAATVRATLLTGQFLTVARHRPLHPVVLAPSEVLRSLVEVLERVLSADVQIAWNLDPDSGYVDIDQGQLEQLVMNLAINARDAMPGGGWISITVARTDVDATSARALGIDPGQYVRIAVADSGTGMDEETRLRCFEPLYTTKGPLKGTGLGLPTVRRVVLECGGAIRLETELGRGTTFDVYLPRIEEETGPSHVGDPVATSGPVQILDTSLEEVTVLLAEDDDDLRRLVRIVLLRAGCRVLEAADGVAALEIARAPDRVIDVLVSDVTMPGTSGREVALALRRDRPALAVLLVSGSTDEHVITDLGPGPTAFLAKPFKPSDVLASVRGLLVAEVHPSAADLSRSGVGETSFG